MPKASEQDTYFAQVEPLNLHPAWKYMPIYAPVEPTTPCVPAVWHFADIEPHLMEGCRVISAKDADRRALLLHNPGLGDNAHGITRTVSGDYQIVMPGEIAPAHRHTQTAFRFFLEGDGAFTAIEGEKIYMHRGDLIVQPPGLWHHHGHDGAPGSAPVIWFDGLDVGLVGNLDAPFFHSYIEDAFPSALEPGDNRARFGGNVVPADFAPTAHDHPMYSYPYGQTRAAIDALRKAAPADPYDGWKVRYINPSNGGYAMPTMAAYLQLLPEAMSTAPYRSTDGTVFVVLEGKGATTVGDTVLDWAKNDVFVVPSWHWHHHAVESEAVLFSYSDRAAQEKLGLWFEERGNRA